MNMLAVRIGARDYLIDLPEAGAIVAVPAVTPVPFTQRWYRGVANLRGQLTAVIDLAEYAGAGHTSLDKDSGLITFGAGLHFHAGILVTRILGLRNAAAMRAVSGETPAVPWLGRELHDGESRPWLPLSLARLTREERFLQAGR